jgi:hypothetical protein
VRSNCHTALLTLLTVLVLGGELPQPLRLMVV